MKENNVLLITYYWPPSGGAGVHRWLRFSKYFKPNGCNLTVYCPEDAAWPVIDKDLEKEVPEDVTVIRRKAFEPHKYLGKGGNPGVGFTQEKKTNPIKKLIVWTRGNFFIPDARVFWINPSVRLLSKYLKDHPEIDTIISTGPPHSMHLIAKKLKERFDIKWIADFRDPWTQIDFYEALLPGDRADKKHKKLEKEVLTKADEVVTVSSACAIGLEEIANRKIHVITNGYSFPNFDQSEVNLDKTFSITHFGSMSYPRNPELLWKALSKLKSEHPSEYVKVEVKLVGSADYKVIESADKHGVKDCISTPGAVNHGESIQLQRQTQLLLLVANNTGNTKGILTGKFFEYLGAKRPILALGEKHSDLEHAVNDTTCGFFAHSDNQDDLYQFLLSSLGKFNSGELKGTATNLDQYRSETLAKKFIGMF